MCQNFPIEGISDNTQFPDVLGCLLWDEQLPEFWRKPNIQTGEKMYCNGKLVGPPKNCPLLPEAKVVGDMVHLHLLHLLV